MMVLQKYTWVFVLLSSVLAEPPINGVRPSNVLGGLEQHASFSFVRPGLTQTAFAFNGPSSHQAFSSSVGDPHLAHRIHPSIAHALAYRNPGLGYAPIPSGPIATAYAAGPPPPPAPVTYQPQFVDYQHQQALALAYHQQLQQYPQQPVFADHPQQVSIKPTSDVGAQQSLHQSHLEHGSRFARPQSPLIVSEAVPEQQQQVHQEQQQQHQPSHTQNLLGVAYSSAPSVAHVKITGNGYHFDF